MLQDFSEVPHSEQINTALEAQTQVTGRGNSKTENETPGIV